MQRTRSVVAVFIASRARARAAVTGSMLPSNGYDEYDHASSVLMRSSTLLRIFPRFCAVHTCVSVILVASEIVSQLSLRPTAIRFLLVVLLLSGKISYRD